MQNYEINVGRKIYSAVNIQSGEKFVRIASQVFLELTYG